MKIFFVETNFDETTVHSLSLEYGTYLNRKKTKGNFKERANTIINFALAEKPDKIIFETVASGVALKEIAVATFEMNGMIVESNGTVYY